MLKSDTQSGWIHRRPVGSEKQKRLATVAARHPVHRYGQMIGLAPMLGTPSVQDSEFASQPTLQQIHMLPPEIVE
ncbi:MAG: hypothetical protein KDD78_07920 [Caldilineaceae bacterium]|nr:hypothetical protein [Caldilineaceae bacterium]